MSKVRNIIARAEEKLREGGLWDMLEAKDLLLEAGFIREKDPEVQAAFYRLFPPTEELQKELESSLRVVLDGDLSARRKAAGHLEKQPRRSMTGYLQGWLKDPRTMEVLCKALDDDDAVVAERVVICIGNIAGRYGYTDLGVYRLLIQKLERTSGPLRISIVQALGAFPCDEKWSLIFDAFGEKPNKRAKMLLTLAVSTYGADMPEDMKQRFRALLAGALEKEKNGDVRNRLLSALGTIGNQSVVDRLRNLKVPARDKGLAMDIERTVAEIEAREAAK